MLIEFSCREEAPLSGSLSLSSSVFSSVPSALALRPLWPALFSSGIILRSAVPERRGMSNPEDRRVHTRLSLDSRHTLRFEVEGRVYRGVELTNVSLGGLGIKLSHRESILMHPGGILKAMVFEHSAMPQLKVDGEIRHVMGQTLQNVDGMVLIGVRYVSPSERFLKQVEAFIEKRMGTTG
jgi:hypothetical protein